MPLAKSTCHSAGLIYTLLGGGSKFWEEKNSGPGGGNTVMVNVQVALLPQASLALQVTILLPTGKVLPLGGLQVTVPPPHPPVDEAVG